MKFSMGIQKTMTGFQGIKVSHRGSRTYRNRILFSLSTISFFLFASMGCTEKVSISLVKASEARISLFHYQFSNRDRAAQQSVLSEIQKELQNYSMVKAFRSISTPVLHNTLGATTDLLLVVKTNSIKNNKEIIDKIIREPFSRVLREHTQLHMIGLTDSKLPPKMSVLFVALETRNHAFSMLSREEKMNVMSSEESAFEKSEPLGTSLSLENIGSGTPQIVRLITFPDVDSYFSAQSKGSYFQSVRRVLKVDWAMFTSL